MQFIIKEKVMDNDKKSKKENKKIAEAISKKQPDKLDPLGSYTGMPVDKFETPTQDADDI
jgi:hypothetical protein